MSSAWYKLAPCANLGISTEHWWQKNRWSTSAILVPVLALWNLSPALPSGCILWKGGSFTKTESCHSQIGTNPYHHLKTGDWYAEHYDQFQWRKDVRSQCTDQNYDSLQTSHKNVKCSLQDRYSRSWTFDQFLVWIAAATDNSKAEEVFSNKVGKKLQATESSSQRKS